MTPTRHSRSCRSIVAALGAAFCLAASAEPAAAALYPPPGLVFTCPPSAGAGSVTPGQTLFRYDIDTTVYPDAICNDGSGAIMYLRRGTTNAGRGKWHIYLQGGGSCRDHQTCADRWCNSGGQSFGTDKMSTLYAPATGIATDGLFTRRAQNALATWNQVFVYYCSSDEWVGTASGVDLPDPNGTGNDYSLNFKGAKIVDAVINTLRRLNGTVWYDDEDADLLANTAMPDLDSAVTVLISGTSAGSNGVRQRVDEIAQRLRRYNLNCHNPLGGCPLQVRALVDADYQPAYETRNWAASTPCAGDPTYCTYDGAYQAEWNDRFIGLYGARVDSSCLAMHLATVPATEWKCSDPIHVLANHVTTPFFVRQDLQDDVLMDNFIGAGFGLQDDFGLPVEAQIADLASIDALSEEGPPTAGALPVGAFAPQCQQHEAIEDRARVFNVFIDDGAGNLINFHDTLVNWLRGAAPYTLSVTYTGPGALPLPYCP